MMDIRKIRCTVPCQVEDAKCGCHCAEARDEITRLRERTEYWPDNAERDAVIRHQTEEIKRLQTALNRLADEPFSDLVSVRAFVCSVLRRGANG